MHLCISGPFRNKRSRIHCMRRTSSVSPLMKSEKNFLKSPSSATTAPSPTLEPSRFHYYRPPFLAVGPEHTASRSTGRCSGVELQSPFSAARGCPSVCFRFQSRPCMAARRSLAWSIWQLGQVMATGQAFHLQYVE